MYDIDSYLSSKQIIPTGAFLLAARDHFVTFQEKYSFLQGKLTMEGFLYPDTYRILPTADAYMILDKLLGEWESKISTTYTQLGASAYDNLILASIVEREERQSSEKAKVADILAKRVKEGIAM
jgi:cell division protein YceG involved in septum cleavage